MSNPAIVQQLRSEGYQDDEIAAELAKGDPKIGTLLGEGYAASEVLNELYPAAAPAAPESVPMDKTLSEIQREQQPAEEAAKMAQAEAAGRVWLEEWTASQPERERLTAAYFPENVDQQKPETPPPPMRMSAMPGAYYPSYAPAPPPSAVEQVKERLKANGEDPTVANIVLGLGAQFGLEEVSKWGGAAAGAALAGAAGQAGPQAALPEEGATMPLGATIGYVTGGLLGGFSGSVLAQKIEGKPNISYGRATADALLALLPFGETKSGPKLLQAASRIGGKSPILRNMAIGAVTAPAAQIAEYNIDKALSDEELMGEFVKPAPTAKQLGVSSATSSALAGAMGLSGKVVSKFLKRRPAEIDTLMRNGDNETVGVVNALNQKSGVSTLPQATEEDARSYIQQLAHRAGSKLAPSKVIGGQAMQAIRDAANMATAGEEVGGVLGKRIDSALAGAANPDQARKLATEYMLGKDVQLPPELSGVAADIAQARGFVREYQEKLLANHYNGTHTLEDNLREKIERSLNDGDYVTRAYRYFQDPNFKPSPELRAKAKAELMADGMDAKQADNYFLELEQKRAGGQEELDSLVRSTNAAVLKKREDVPPALREYLGEYVEPGERLQNTMSRLSRLVAYDTADRTIRDSLLAVGLARKAGEGVPEGFVPLTLRRGEQAIDGATIAVPREVQTAVNQLYGSKSDEAFQDLATAAAKSLWGNMVTWSKASKVVLNPPSYLVNLYGNVASLIGQGMNPFKGFATANKMAATQFADHWLGRIPGIDKLASAMPNERVAMMKELTELGVLKGGLAFDDMVASLKNGRNILDNITKATIEPFGKAYSHFDSTLRLVSYYNNLATMQRMAVGALDGNALNALKKKAAAMTNDTFQNYDYLNSSLRSMSRMGIPLSQFASFSMELFRNTYNQAAIASKMMSGKFADELESELGITINRAAMRNEGAKRAIAMMGVIGAASGGVQMWNRSHGVDEKKEQAWRETGLPDWDAQANMLMSLSEDGKTMKYANASYMIPHAQLMSPIMAALRGEDRQEATKNYLTSLWNDVGGEGSFAMNTLAQVAQNAEMDTGRRISVSPDSVQNMADRAKWGIQNLAEPGFMREVRKSRSQDPSTTALRQVGVRINETPFEKGLSFKAKGIKQAHTQLASEWAGIGYQLKDGKLSQADAEAEYARFNDAYVKHSANLVRHVNNARTVGFSDDEIIKMLKGNGVGSKHVLAAIEGRTLELPKTKTPSISDIYDEQYAELTLTEQKQKLREFAKEDPVRARALVDHIKEVERIGRMNVSEKDKLIKALSSTDGSRAEYVYGKMKASSNPRETMREFVRRGIVNDSVAIQIKRLEELERSKK